MRRGLMNHAKTDVVLEVMIIASMQRKILPSNLAIWRQSIDRTDRREVPQVLR